MKMPLTNDIVKRLRIDSKPLHYDSKGKLVWGDNPEGKEYFVFCSHQNSPVGFGVRVSGKKTYIIQRRVRGENKVVKATIGYCSDMTLDEARARAADFGLTIKDTGQNPNEVARLVSEMEPTVERVMTTYKTHLITDRKSVV